MHRNHPPSPPFLLSIKQRSAIYAPSLPSMEREQGWSSSSFQEPLPARREKGTFFLSSSIVFVTFRYISNGTDIDTFSNIHVFENFYMSTRYSTSVN